MNEKELAGKIMENTSVLSRVECKVMAFLLLHTTEYQTSREIEYAMLLRQPEVSMVLSAFRKHKWIKESSIHKHGEKGRPIKLIKLSKSQKDIFGSLIEKADKQIRKYSEQKEELIKLEKLFK